MSVYGKIVERLFERFHVEGSTAFEFRREDIAEAARDLGLPPPKNLGDVIYSFRYRKALPSAVRALAPSGKEWIVRSVAPSVYAFVAERPLVIEPTEGLSVTKVPDSTPGIIARYSLTDEQAMLARLRYNRLIDIFLRITCYPLQSHLRTSVRRVQVETDELYVGLDRRGAHYVVPVPAKGPRDRLSVIQVEQDAAMCREKFPDLICRPVGARLPSSRHDRIVLFEFECPRDEVTILRERQYELVPPEEPDRGELLRYAARTG